MDVTSDKYIGTKEFHLVYAELLRAARYRGVITYQDVAQIMSLPLAGSHMGRETGHLLGEISKAEVNSGRPMLSAIAVNTEGKPGPGFYGLADELGRLKDDSNEAQRRFWENERERVYETWAPRRSSLPSH